jgi:hypothetical protein
MQSWSEVKETAFWILAILGAFALVYLIGCYGTLLARIH